MLGSIMAAMSEVIGEYFIKPIFERTGYNAVNTLVYALIALAALYFLWRFFKGKKFDFGSKDFLYAIAAFVLFGSTARVATDLSDAGVIASAAQTNQFYAALDASGIFAYGYLTVTPGIYIVTALLLLLSIAVGHVVKNPRFPAYAGLALFVPCLVLLLPFALHFDYLLLGVGIAIVGTAVAFAALKKILRTKLQLHEKLAIFGQALDGAATFVVIDIFAKQTGKSYFEQHVLSAGIGAATPLGFGLFLLVKIALASAIVYFLSKEKMDGNDKAFVLIVIAIMGFAPGIRDLLRMLVGS